MDMILTPTDHLSPPSTTSRLSDSDTTSECDIDGIATGRDGASISSLGSSSSPPAEVKQTHWHTNETNYYQIKMRTKNFRNQKKKQFYRKKWTVP